MMAYSNSSTQRIFPPIQPDLYTTSENWTPLTSDQRVAQTILALANQEFTRWEWLVGWKLDSLGQIGRLLQQHKLAMEAELAAQWQKADFFWTQVQIEVKRLSRRHNVWQALALAMSGDEPGVVVMGDRFRLRQRLVDELLIDTHFAFYNGLAGRGEKLSFKDRAFVHIDYIMKLFDLSDLPEDQLLSVLGQAWQKQLGTCPEDLLRIDTYTINLIDFYDFSNENKVHLTIKDIVYNWLKKYMFPGFCYVFIFIFDIVVVLLICFTLFIVFNFIDKFILIFSAILSISIIKLTDSIFKKQILKEAKKIQRETNKFKRISKNYQHNLRFFELVADLYHLQSIKLVNKGYLAEALFLANKSLNYNPLLTRAVTTRNKLTEMMRYLQLQFQVRSLETQIARQTDVNLTKKEKHLITQAKKGFALANAYLKSREAQATADAFKVAQASSIWQSIGLGKAAKDWSKQALLLYDELNWIVNNPPQDQAGIADNWRAVTITHPTLGELDPVLIHAFLERKLFGTGNEPIVTLPNPPNSPRLTPVYSKRKPGTEPFLLWLFSRQNIRLKLQAIIASILLLTAGMLTIQDLSIRSARNVAYQQIQEAELQQDILGVIQGSEKFLGKTPLSGEDERDQQVREIYSSALVRWLARQNNPLDEDTQVHIDRYQRISKNFKERGKQQ